LFAAAQEVTQPHGACARVVTQGVVWGVLTAYLWGAAVFGAADTVIAGIWRADARVHYAGVVCRAWVAIIAGAIEGDVNADAALIAGVVGARSAIVAVELFAAAHAIDTRIR